MFRWQNLRSLRICWINDDVIRRLWTNHNPCLSINISSFISSKSRGQISTPTQPFKSWLCSWARRFKTFEKCYFQISAFRKRVIFILKLRIKLKTLVVMTFCSGNLTKTLFSAPKWGAPYRWSSLYCPLLNPQEMTIGKTHPTFGPSNFAIPYQCLGCLFDVFHESPF